MRNRILSLLCQGATAGKGFCPYLGGYTGKGKLYPCPANIKQEKKDSAPILWRFYRRDHSVPSIIGGRFN
jgi:hypothetical protein